MCKIKDLRSVVLTDRVLLHGSPNNFNEIRPHLTDGEMAICATPYPELAVTMAVLNACGFGGHGYTVSMRNSLGSVRFRMEEKKLALLLQGDPTGYVYALDAEAFKRIDPIEYRAYDPCYTLRKMSVTKEHLPFLPTEGQTEYVIALNLAPATIFN